MPNPAFLDWLDAHSGTVTAMATVILVAVTVAYVIVTYFLVREQRLQKPVPKVEFEFLSGQSNQVGGEPRADLSLQNVGTGTATELAILSGPRDGISADLQDLGNRMTLLPSEECVWRIRPPDGGQGFSEGELPLTMTYFGNDKTKVVFEVLILRFEPRASGWTGNNLGSMELALNRRELRRLTRKDLRLGRRLKFRWESRSLNMSRLLLRDDVRLALRGELESGYEELLVTAEQMKLLHGSV
jgi:hypothetical protein